MAAPAERAGRYVSTIWIPGDFLSEGVVLVSVAISTYIPDLLVHADARGAVAFRVMDRLDPESARGDYKGLIPGAVRPLLKWITCVEGARASRSEALIPEK